MRKRIKHSIDIVTFPNGPTYLVYVVNPSYYHWAFNEGTGIFLMIIFSFRFHVAEKALVDRSDWFDVILNLLQHLELLIYAKIISFLVGSNNVYGVISYQFHLLTWINTHPPLFFNCGIMVMFYLAAGTPQHFYQDRQKYVLIGVMNFYWSKSSDQIIPNSICNIIWRIFYVVSIKEEIPQNPPFQSSGPLLLVLNVSRNIDFCDTREVSLIGSYCMCYFNRNECVLKIVMNVSIQYNFMCYYYGIEQTIG